MSPTKQQTPNLQIIFFSRKNIFSFCAKVQKRVTYSSHNNNISKNRQQKKKKETNRKKLRQTNKVNMLLFPLEHLPKKIIFELSKL